MEEDPINTLRPRQNGRRIPDDIFKRIFMNENICVSIKVSLKFVPKVPINNTPALVQIMAWRRPGDKPLSEPMMNILLTHICVTRPQWVSVCQVIPCLSCTQYYISSQILRRVYWVKSIVISNGSNGLCKCLYIYIYRWQNIFEYSHFAEHHQLRYK